MSRLVRFGTVAGAVPCALAAHAAVYRSFWPSDGVHGYFGWYQPAVGALSAASVVALVGFLAVARVARACGSPLRLRAPAARIPLGRAVRSYASTAVALFLLQELLERSISAGRPSAAALLPSQWLTLFAAAALAALVLVLALRLAEAVVRTVLQPDVVVLRGAARRWSVVAASPVRLRPLAARFALRAPPALSF